MTVTEAPVPAGGFRWVPAPWGVLLVAEALERFRHGWTTRQLALRGSPKVEAAGWARVAASAGGDPSMLVRLHQVHGNSVFDADSPGPRPAEADAAVSRNAARVLTVQTADCVPILIADGRSGAAGVAHAGWRGTAAGVSREAARRLATLSGSEPGVLIAALGPSIGPCCYEVGTELIDRFAAAGWASRVDDWFVRHDGRLHLDLWRANRDQLIECGVPAAGVHVSALCTSCHREWFPSYRRDGAGAGRIAGVIRAGAPSP
jgi:YfiH family protein